jgi:hypothetical protein
MFKTTRNRGDWGGPVVTHSRLPLYTMERTHFYIPLHEASTTQSSTKPSIQLFRGTLENTIYYNIDFLLILLLRESKTAAPVRM